MIGVGSAEAQEQVAQLLIRLSEQPANRHAVVEVGGVKRLVAQLRGAASLLAQELASVVLLALAADTRENVDELISHGGIKPLVGLLRTGSVDTVVRIATGLAHVCQHSRDVQMLVAREGGVEMLVSIVSGYTPEPAESQPEVPRHSDRRQSVVTSPSSSSPMEMLRASAAARRGSISPGGVPAVPAQPVMVHSIHGRAEAARALRSLTTSNVEMAERAVAGGAIPPLVALLGSGESDGTANGTDAPPADGGSGPGAEVDGGGLRAHAQCAAAGAIASLAAGGSDFQVAMAAADTIEALVRLLGEEHGDEVRTQAAAALARTVEGQPANQTAMAESGGIRLAVRLLLRSVDGDGGGKDQPPQPLLEQTAAAVWACCAGHATNQAVVRDEGGIAPLVRLLSASAEGTQHQAAGALGALTLENEENTAAVSSLVVRLLDESRETADETTGTKAALALSRLARETPSSHRAIAAVGGIPLLTGMLQRELADVLALTPSHAIGSPRGSSAANSSPAAPAGVLMPADAAGMADAIQMDALLNRRRSFSSELLQIDAAPKRRRSLSSELLVGLEDSARSAADDLAERLRRKNGLLGALASALWSLSLDDVESAAEIAREGAIPTLM